MPGGETPGESLTGGAAYLPELMTWTVETVLGSDIVKAQTASPDTDVLTGLPFDTEGVYAQDETGQRAALRGFCRRTDPGAAGGHGARSHRNGDGDRAGAGRPFADHRLAFRRGAGKCLRPVYRLRRFLRLAEGNLRAFGAEAAQTVTQLRLYADSFSARETLGAVLRGYAETVTYADAASGLVQPGMALMESAEKTDRLGMVLVGVLAGALIVLVSALAASARRRELWQLRMLGLSSPQGIVGAESLLLGLFGGVLGAALRGRFARCSARSAARRSRSVADRRHCSARRGAPFVALRQTRRVRRTEVKGQWYEKKIRMLHRNRKSIRIFYSSLGSGSDAGSVSPRRRNFGRARFRHALRSRMYWQ